MSNLHVLRSGSDEILFDPYMHKPSDGRACIGSRGRVCLLRPDLEGSEKEICKGELFRIFFTLSLKNMCHTNKILYLYQCRS